MLLTYLDESYSSRAYFMAALVCPEQAANPLTEALDEVVAKAAAAHGTSRTAELHGHDLFQAKGDWTAWRKSRVYGSASTTTLSRRSPPRRSRSSSVVSTAPG